MATSHLNSASKVHFLHRLRIDHAIPYTYAHVRSIKRGVLAKSATADGDLNSGLEWLNSSAQQLNRAVELAAEKEQLLEAAGLGQEKDIVNEKNGGSVHIQGRNVKIDQDQWSHDEADKNRHGWHK